MLGITLRCLRLVELLGVVDFLLVSQICSRNELASFYDRCKIIIPGMGHLVYVRGMVAIVIKAFVVTEDVDTLILTEWSLPSSRSYWLLLHDFCLSSTSFS